MSKSQYVLDIENQLMIEDTDNLVMSVEQTGQEYDDGVDVWIETTIELFDGTKNTSWLALIDGQVMWDDLAMPASETSRR